MRKNIIILTIWLYFSSSLIINCGPIQSKLSKLVPSNGKAIQENQENRALVAAGQGDGRPAAPAAPAVVPTVASLAHVQRLRRYWDPYTFRNWFDYPVWSFSIVGHDGSRRALKSISCSPNGDYVAAGERMTSPLPVFAINHTTGALERVNDTYEYNKLGFHKVAYSTNSKHIAALREGSISHNPCLALFDVASGRLTPTKGFKEIIQEFSSSSHIAYSPNGKWLALSNSEPYRIDNNNWRFLPNGQRTQRSVEGGKFLTLYGVDQETGVLNEGFAMTERGYVCALVDLLNRGLYSEHHSHVGPYTDTRTETRAIRFSPDSNWLITAEYLRSRINVFKVDNNTGRLTFTCGIGFKDMGDIAFSPDGRYVAISSYVSQYVKENNLSLFHFDSNTGELEPIAGSPFKTGDGGPSAIAFSPGGRMIAVVHHLDNDTRPDSALTVLHFDAALKTLVPVPGSPFAAPEGGSQSVCYSPNGELLFVGSAHDDRIWVYEVDEFTGSLDFITGKPLLKVQKKYEYAMRLLQENNYIIPAIAKFVRAYYYQETVAPQKPTQEH